MLNICIVSELNTVVEIYVSKNTPEDITFSILDLDEESITPADINEKYKDVVENMECIYKR